MAVDPSQWRLNAAGYRGYKDMAKEYNNLYAAAARRWLVTRGYTHDQLIDANLNGSYQTEQQKDIDAKIKAHGYTDADMQRNTQLGAKILYLERFRKLGITVDAAWPLSDLIHKVRDLGYIPEAVEKRFPDGTDITFYMDVDPATAARARRALLRWVEKYSNDPELIKSKLQLLGYSILNVTDAQAPIGLSNIINGMTDNEVFVALVRLG